MGAVSMRKTLAKWKLFTAMAIFGTVGVFVKYIPLPSATIALGRGLVGLAFLVLVMVFRGQRPDIAGIKRNLPVLLLSGAAVGGNWILLFESYRHTTVAVATICYYTAPAFLMLASPLLGEKLTCRKLLCVGVSFCGMIFLSGVLQGGISGGTGLALGVGAAVLYATVMFLNQKLRGIGALDRTLVQLAAACVVILPYVLLSGGLDMELMTGGNWGMLFLVGVVHTGFAYTLYFGSMEDLPSQTVAVFSYLDPVAAILLSAVFLREPLHWQGILGAALILGSALFGELDIQKFCKNFGKKG